MADDTARGAPEQNATATATAEAPAAPASSLQQNQDLSSKFKAAKSPADVRALLSQQKATMNETIKTQPKDWKGPDAAGKPAADAPVETAATPEETPAAEETAAEEPVADDSAPEAADDEADADEDDGGEGLVSPITGKRTHLRLAQDDKVGRLAASFMKRNRDMPMEEALERARNQLGIKPKDAAPAEPAAPKSDLPATVDDTDALIRTLRADRKKANTELRFEDVSDLSDKLEDLIQHRSNLERDGERHEAAQASAYDQQFTASEARAVDLYEFAGKPESDGAKRMMEIEADLKANDDPLYNSPDKPLRIAQMVAAELKIAPRRKGAPAAPAKAAAPATGTPPVKKQVLPGGSSRTTLPPVNQPSAIDTAIKAAPPTIAGLRELRKQLGLPR